MQDQRIDAVHDCDQRKVFFDGQRNSQKDEKPFKIFCEKKIERKQQERRQKTDLMRRVKILPDYKRKKYITKRQWENGTDRPYPLENQIKRNDRNA